MSLETRLVAKEVEGYGVSLAGDGRVGAAVVALAPIGGQRPAGGGAVDQIAHEDVALVVGVAGHEVGGGRVEGQQLAVGRRDVSSAWLVDWPASEGTLARTTAPLAGATTNTSSLALVREHAAHDGGAHVVRDQDDLRP